MTKIYKQATPIDTIFKIINVLGLIALVVMFFPIIVIFKVCKAALIG